MPSRHRERFRTDRKTEGQPGADRKRCSRCRRVKPLSAFYARAARRAGHSSWCRNCVRIGVGGHRETEEYRKWLNGYLSREDVRERRRQADQKRAGKPETAAKRKAYRATPRTKLLHSRRQARVRLKKASTEERREALGALIRMLTAEIDRLADR